MHHLKPHQVPDAVDTEEAVQKTPSIRLLDQAIARVQKAGSSVGLINEISVKALLPTRKTMPFSAADLIT